MLVKNESTVDGVVWGVQGAVLLFTAATTSCLLHRLVGIDTTK